MDLKALAVLQLSIRQTLHQFALGGEYDGIFDGNVDVLGQHPVQTFELRSLLQRPRLVGPVLGYVFPEIERQMRTDAPMFLLLDDAAVTWLTPQQGAHEQADIRRKLEQRCRDWLMTTRKKNVSLGFSTHSLSQVFSSALGPLLEEGCPSRFFLPDDGGTGAQHCRHLSASGAHRERPPDDCHESPATRCVLYVQGAGTTDVLAAARAARGRCLASNTA